MQPCAALRHGCIDGQYSSVELWQNAVFQPCPQYCPLSNVLTLNRQNPKFQLHDGDGGHKKVGSINVFGPRRNVRIRLTLFNVLGVLLLLPLVFQLAAFLERHVQFAAKPMEQPRYLYSGALETPASAINAVRKELNRLYDNTYDLLAHGLSLEHSVINSDQSLTAATAATRKMTPLDVDDVYERKIKSLHSAIIAFISSIQGRGGLEESSAQQLYELQQASRDLVAAVKAMKHLHKNLSRYGLATDPMIREPYNRIRRQIALTLREIAEIRSQDPEAVTSLSLDGLKLSLEQLSRKFTADLNGLIHDGRLAPNIATSMMNDESYTYELCENLIEAAEALVQPGSAEDDAAESKLALDDEDIARIVETTANPDTLLETRPIR